MANPGNFQAQLRQINIVYWAMALIQVFFGATIYLLITTGFTTNPDYELALTFQKIALFIVPGSMAAGYFLFRYQLRRIDRSLSLEEKLKKYFSLTIVRGALFEAGFLFCCIAALITGVQLFLWMAPVVFLVFLLLRPTPQGMTSDLQLNPDDSNRLMQS